MKKARASDAGASAYAKRVATKIAVRHEFFRDSIGVKNIAIIVQEAFEEYGITQRLAARVAEPKWLFDNDVLDVYDNMNPKLREFAEKMDLYTLEQVIIRVMTELDHRRRKYLGGYEGMAKHKKARSSVSP